MIATLLLSVALACAQDAGRAARNDPDEVPTFSVDSAWAYLQRQVAFGPRVPGTAGHTAQLAWMQEFLAARADTVIRQDFRHAVDDGVEIELTNLFARFRPDESARVLLLAHWDTRPTADNDRREDRNKAIPGANDGASGVAVLLELANVLARDTAPIGVDLLFVDGEDFGPGSEDMYLGAKYFAANLPQGYRPLYGILLDMIADQNPIYEMEGHSMSRAPEVVERVWRLAQDMGHGGVFVRRNGIAVLDDHIPLNDAGIRTIDIIDFDYGPGNQYWHTLEDDVAHVSPRGLGVVGQVLTALIYRGG